MKNLDFYIAKNFIIKFVQIIFAFSLLIFFVNFLEIIDKVDEKQISIATSALMAFLQIPNFLNDIAPSIVLFASMITFFFLSLRSEITIIRSSGYSLWSITKPLVFAAFALGIFWIAIFGPVVIIMNKKYDFLERKYVKQELREVVESENGIWLKQINIDNPKQEIIIQASKAYRENLEFDTVSVWFFDAEGKYYRRINAQKMFFLEHKLLLKNVIINDTESINKYQPQYEIATNLDAKFVMDKIVTNFQNVKLFSLYKLPSLILSLQNAGFQSTKFEVYFHNLLSKPLLFVSMVLISCFFGINHVRNQGAIINVFLGIILGLALYITLSFVSALGSSRIIPVFVSTWVITFICLAIGVLLIYKKESA